MVHEEMPQAWWFDSHSLAKPSPWLGNTLSELDGKIKQMLKLIDQDADTFAQRAEVYYKKRPVLVDMLGDLYRAHRSLAEKYDLLKHGGGTRRTKQSLSPRATIEGKRTEWSSSTSAFSDSYVSESEVDDPEEEHDQKTPEAEDQPDQEAELMRAEIKRLKDQNSELQKVIEENARALKDQNSQLQKVIAKNATALKDKNSELQKVIAENATALKDKNSELQKVIEENATALEEVLATKDEEKREVIRQLASCIGIIKEENFTLRECIKRWKQHSPPPPSFRCFDFKKLTKDLLCAKLFSASGFQQAEFRSNGISSLSLVAAE